jgi:pimeloyl-ACP methyl ester carboxylesterase
MKYIYQVPREILLMVSYPIFGFVGLFVKKGGVNEQGKPTIVIVERWFNENILHIYWKKYLEKKGFRVYLLNFKLPDGTFEQSAEKLKEFISREELENFYLVGISGGGLTGLLYLQEHGGWEKVKKFIPVGTPFGGTLFALAVSFVGSGRELLPGSGLVKKISQMRIEHLSRIVCIRAKNEAVIPNKSNYVEGTRCELIDVFGHNALHMVTRRTYDEIAKIASSSN